MAATDRAALRASLQRKTDAQLTNSTDQDIYLALAERQTLSDWMQFDPTIVRYARDSAATSASGILLMDADFVELERLEDENKVQYPKISPQEHWTGTGYYFAGWKSDNTQRQIQIVKNGAALASTTLYFFSMKLVLMGATGTDQPCIPEEYRDVIAIRAAQLWYEDQGETMQKTAEVWEARYGRWMARAKRAYKNLDSQPTFAKSMDPDAGAGGFFTIHRT